MNTNQGKRDGFGSKLGIIAAAAGSAVGLGNIYRFPYVAGENGGGAFLLMYLLIVLIIGVPLMLTEFTLGRSAQKNSFGTFKELAPKSLWYLVGVIGIIAAFTILSFYSTVSGWTVQYLFDAIRNNFEGMDSTSLKSHFDSFVMDGYLPILWQLVFMVLTALIVLGGIKNGIEKATKIMMPLLLLIIIVLIINSLFLDGVYDGLSFLFMPDLSKITTNSILEALGQAFFSLSIGMGVLITYGSYIQKKDNLANTAVSVTLIDTLVAVLAGMAIFPAVFSFGVSPESGPQLVFVTLPLIFENMMGGYFFSIIFFVLLALAALTSTISILEVVVAFMVEELGWTRKKATIISALSIYVLGVACTLSQGPMPQLSIFGKNLFDAMDFLSTNILLPFGGLLIVIFAGWVVKPKLIKDEITNNGVLKGKLFPVYLFIIRFIAPVAIILVFLNGMNIL